MKLIRISALVAAGAVAMALAACSADQDAAGDSKNESASSDKSKDDSGSGDAGEGKSDPGGDLNEIAKLTLTKSGGFSGMKETLEVEANGDWKYVKARMAPQKGELSGGEVDELMTLASDGGITDVDKKSDKQCNDMQVYGLVIVGDNGDEVKANTDKCGVSPNEKFNDIVQLLGEATPI